MAKAPAVNLSKRLRALRYGLAFFLKDRSVLGMALNHYEHLVLDLIGYLPVCLTEIFLSYLKAASKRTMMYPPPPPLKLSFSSLRGSVP